VNLIWKILSVEGANEDAEYQEGVGDGVPEEGEVEGIAEVGDEVKRQAKESSWEKRWFQWPTRKKEFRWSATWLQKWTKWFQKGFKRLEETNEALRRTTN